MKNATICLISSVFHCMRRNQTEVFEGAKSDFAALEAKCLFVRVI